ncbi:MAG: sigma-70 family RNA polymerase sigma factor [Bacteroidales bacterium]|nr:sigma-70 family RNA polymerase sigma factor [Bacteroidales bacterium]
MLPPRCRQVFHLSYIEGYTAAEISSMLGISVSTVNNQIYKSLQILRKELATA